MNIFAKISVAGMARAGDVALVATIAIVIGLGCLTLRAKGQEAPPESNLTCANVQDRVTALNDWLTDSKTMLAQTATPALASPSLEMHRSLLGLVERQADAIGRIVAIFDWSLANRCTHADRENEWREDRPQMVRALQDAQLFAAYIKGIIARDVGAPK